MAFGRLRSFPTLLILGIIAASCSAGGSAADTGNGAPPDDNIATSTTSPTSTTTTVPATTTSKAPTTTITTTTTSAPTTTTPATTTTAGIAGAEVLIPEGQGPFPAVVLAHGGGWIAGDPTSMSALARYLTENGFLTVNTPYALAVREASFPEAVDDVACAVRYASGHPDSDGTVAVLGHSAGAHLSALVALTGDSYAADCPFAGSGLPERLIGLAGPYDIDRVGLLMLPFFGGGPDVEPEAWEAGNPMNFADENPELSSLIMYGEFDALVEPGFAIDFHDALVGAGTESTIELVEGARHMDLRDPAWVGDLIAVWLER